MSANAVEIRGLEKSFDTFTLGRIDLTVPAGAIYGFVGPNGAGKTTTIDLIFGMGSKDAGSITVLGLDHLRDEVAMKRQVAYVGPDLNFLPWSRVRRVIQFVRGFYPTWDQAYCDRLLTALDVGPNEKLMTMSSFLVAYVVAVQRPVTSLSLGVLLSLIGSSALVRSLTMRWRPAVAGVVLLVFLAGVLPGIGAPGVPAPVLAVVGTIGLTAAALLNHVAFGRSATYRRPTVPIGLPPPR